MTPFIVAALLLTATIVAMLTWPFYRAHDEAVEVDAARLNAALLKEELAALERDRTLGLLDEASFAQARDDLTRRLLDENAMHAPVVLRTGRPMRAFAAIALGVPLVAGLLYATRGTPEALLPGATVAAVQADGAPAGPDGAGSSNGAGGAPSAAPAEVAKMVEGLSAKLAANPDDPKGWAMLGRSYTVMGRYDDAVKAFARIGPTLDGNAAWLAEYADALAMQAGGNPLGKPEEMSLKALRIDPDNVLALMMASYGAAARSDFAATVPLVEHALKLVPEGSDDQRFLKDLLAKVRAHEAGATGEATTGATNGAAAAPTATQASPAPAAAADPTSLSVEVDLAPALRAQARGKVLFVIARAPGQRMPLAVVRRIPDAWPVRVSLDAQSTLDPQRPLSGVPTVEVEARLSAGGTPQAATGDLLATTDLPTGRTLAATITIDHRRP